MSTTFATLPRELIIDGVVHVQHWRSQNFAVYQNYTQPVASSNDPLADPAPQVSGQNLFHVFAVEEKDGGEELGSELLTTTSLAHAMDFVAKQEQLA